MSSKIIPVLLGADLNCYSVARAFHEKYRVKSYVFGKMKLGPISHSRIIAFAKLPDLEKTDEVLSILIAFAKSKKSKPYLVGCTDEYALFIINNQSTLNKYFFCPCPSKRIAAEISDKAGFYRKCNEMGLLYPQSIIISSLAELNVLCDLPFDYPIIIKPSSSWKYWKHPFPSMRKVYVAHSKPEAERITSDIYNSGYDGEVIFQEKIPENNQYVMTCFSENGKAKSLCLGRVLLGENTPKGIGNHVAVITECNSSLYSACQKFLDNIKYNGFSNFDILYDERRDKYFFLEINLRQGRSNYYVTSSGMNIAEIIVERSSSDSTNFNENKVFWHCVPKSIIYKNCSQQEKATAKRLVANGKSFSSMKYKYDMINPIRLVYLAVHNVKFFKKYKTYEFPCP